MEQNPTNTGKQRTGAGRSRSEEEAESNFSLSKASAYEVIFKAFFDRLQNTTINIRATNVGDDIDPRQKEEFELRSDIIGNYRGSYLTINAETAAIGLGPRADVEPVSMDLDEYIGQSPLSRKNQRSGSTISNYKKS